MNFLKAKSKILFNIFLYYRKIVIVGLVIFGQNHTEFVIYSLVGLSILTLGLIFVLQPHKTTAGRKITIITESILLIIEVNNILYINSKFMHKVYD